MAHALTLDTLQYAKRLQKAGFTEVQVEVQVEIIKEQSKAFTDLIDDSLATKQDIYELKRDIKELDLKIEAIKNEIVIKLGGMVVATGGVMLLLMKLFRM